MDDASPPRPALPSLQTSPSSVTVHTMFMSALNSAVTVTAVPSSAVNGTSDETVSVFSEDNLQRL
jgi:hypothetical protein